MDLNFNADEHEEMADFSILPKGWYLCMVTKDERRESKKTPGSFYMGLEYTIMDGPMKGRKIFANLNLWHASPDTVAMAQRELKSICTSINKKTLGNSQDLYNIPFGVNVGHKKNKMTQEMGENVKGYCGEKEFASKKPATPSTTAGTGTATDATGPWAKPE